MKSRKNEFDEKEIEIIDEIIKTSIRKNKLKSEKELMKALETK